MDTALIFTPVWFHLVVERQLNAYNIATCM